MKPKFRRFSRKFRRIAFRGLPALIIFSVASINPADAAVVPTDAAGDYTVVAVEANTIQGLGGASNVITVPLGTTLLGDVVALDGIQIISQGVGPVYSVNNAGLISVIGGGQAVESLVLPVNITNTGTMINTSDNLIVIGGGSAVTNSGVLSGEDHAIVINGNGTVTNTGTIVGDNDAGTFGDGVVTTGDLSLTNSGAISGAQRGVGAAGTLVAISNAGTIIGTNTFLDGIGIQATNSTGLSTISNTGIISGDVFGISAGSLNSLINSGTIASTDAGGSDAVTLSGSLGGLNNSLGGVITAAATTGGTGLEINGNLGTGAFLNSVNAGTIVSGSGANADGVRIGGALSAGHNFINTGTITASLGDDGVDIGTLSGTLDNQGTIVGADNGVEVDTATVGGTITNSGTITGLANNGIDAGDNITILNTNIITGNVDGVNVDDDANIINTGAITGTTGNGVTAQDDLILTTTGTISGDVTGVEANENASIVNTGTITGADEDGIAADDELTLTNSGTITGDDNGVQAQDEAIITNTGTITGANGNGVDVANELSLVNTNIITGDDDGVSGDDSAVITNSGTITGITDDGIEMDDTLTLDNSGTVTGADNGVEVDEDATITNQAAGVINGTGGDGILATLDLDVTNDGSITGGDDGIDAGDSALIDNNATGTITGTTGDGIFAGALLGLTNDGAITGAVNGVQAGASATIDNNATGTITGNGGDGVQAGALLDLSNAGSITGSVNGVEAGDTAVIDNLLGGTITGNGGDGVNAGNALDLANDGSITGSVDGVDALDSAVIVNSSTGVITGNGGDGVVVDNLLNLTNSGSITGTDDGVDALNTATIVNNAAGTISGGDDGIDAVDSLNLTNAGTITGGDEGVEAGNSATVLNQLGGTITGTGGDGLDVGASLSLTNNGTINGAGGDGVDAGASASIVNNNLITGGSGDGIEADNFLSLTNNATITGNDDGVDAADNATITNQFGATITGTNSDAVEADSFLVLSNTGTLTGGDDGVDAGDNAFVTNTFFGVIVGSDDGVNVEDNSVVNNNFGGVITGTNGDGVDFDGAVGSTLNNSGTINGADGALDGSSGDDVFNLNDGSVINGDVFGWGGSDTINFSGGLTSPFGLFDTTENIIHGDVFDVEFINKTGSGFAVIGDGGIDYDNNTITDPLVTVEANLITVTSGGLIINGNVIATDGVSTSTVNVLDDAELDGTGTWTANVNLDDDAIFSAGATAISLTSQTGLITPEDAIGSLTILGTVTDNGSAFRWDVAPQTPVSNGVNSDLVTANTYVINGMDLHISPTNLDETITNGVYTIIATNNPVDITGIDEVGVQFNSNIDDLVGFEGSEIFNNLDDLNTNTVLGSFFATVTTSGDGTDVLLEIQHDFEGLPGLTATQRSIGAVFDVESDNPDADIQDFLAALDYSSLEEVQAVLQALDPSAQLGMVASIINSNYRVNRMVQNHLFDLRVCEEPMMIAPSGAKDAKGVVAPQQSVAAPSHRYGAWGSLSYDWQDLEGSDDVSDFDGNVGAFTAGFDWRVNPTLAFGILLDGSKADLDHGSGDTDIDSLRVAVYGTWGACTGWYSDFLLGYGKHDLDTDRSTIFGSVDSSSDADSIQALWTVGYTFASGNLKHGPFGGFEYQRVDADGFEEDGDIIEEIPVSVDDYEVDSLRALIGYRVNTTYGKFRPYASIAYAHEFGDDEISTNASLGGIFDGASFRVTGPDLSSAILLSAGTGFSINESLTLDVGYRGEISVGDDGVDSHGGSIGLNWTF
jgi:uncharacterized protein YhjY with autotransporter beta-barrel domain